MAFKNLVYFFLHVLGNNMAACLNFMRCQDHRHFHGKWCRDYMTNNYIYVCSSRRHIKSTWVQGIAVWEGLRSPQTIVVIMNSAPQVRIWMDLFHATLEFVLTELGVDIKVVSSAIDKGIKLSNGTVIYPRSLEMKFRGLNPTIIILDDFLDPLMRMSFLAAESRFRADILGTIADDGDSKVKVLYVGTIIQEGDVTHKISTGELGYGLFVGGVYPAIAPSSQQVFKQFVNDLVTSGELKSYIRTGKTNLEIPEIEVLWPEVRDLRFLTKMWAVQDLEFEIEYLLNVMPEENALIPNWMLERAKDEGLVLGREPAEKAMCYMGVDLQISVSTQGDWTVLISLEVLEDEVRIIDMQRFRGAQLGTDGKRGEVEDHIMIQIKRQYEQYSHAAIFIEMNAFQRTIANSLRREHQEYPIHDYNTGSEKHTFSVGVPSLRTLFVQNSIRIPWGDARSRELMGQLLYELRGMQYEAAKRTYVSKARTKDCVMALWIAMLAVHENRTVGFSKVFGLPSS